MLLWNEMLQEEGGVRCRGKQWIKQDNRAGKGKFRKPVGVERRMKTAQGMMREQLTNGKRSWKGTQVEQMVGGVGKARKWNSWKTSSEERVEMETSNIQGELSITTGVGKMAEKCWRQLSRNQLMGDDKELMFEKCRQCNFKQKSSTKGFQIFQASPILELLLPPAL